MTGTMDASGNTHEGFWGKERENALDAKLDMRLTAQRDAFGGGKRKLTYLEGHAAIAQLNRLFGYGGWSYSVDAMGVDEYTEGSPEGWYAGFWATVTLRVGGVSRQDVGCVEVQNTGKSGSVRDNVHNVDSRSTARKGAVTDALKRAARTFGQQLGNGLYDTDDNIYAWMVAHGLSDDEGEPATAPGAAPAGNGSGNGAAPPHAARRTPEPEREDAALWTRARLRAAIETATGLEIKGGSDWAALARVYDQNAPSSGADITVDWLLCLYQEIRARGYAEEIAAAASEDEVAALVRTALGDSEKRHVGMAHYLALSAQGEARKAELSSPLMAAVPATVAS